MKKFKDIFKFAGVAALLTLLAAGCTKEPPVETGANFEIVTQQPLKAGESINFEITDNADFFTFYSGETGAEYINYPKDKGKAVDKIFSYTYLTAGTYEITLVANSYGEQGSKHKSAVITKTITVIDTRTGFSQFDIVSPGLTGKIDNTKGEITFSITSNQNITALVPFFLTVSPSAKVYLSGTEAVVGAPVNFAQDTMYKVVAPNGEQQDFRVIFYRLPADTNRQLLTFRASTLNVNATINQETKRVDLVLPATANLAAVKVAGTSSGKSIIKIGTRTITSAGVTVNIATQPTVITVTAESGDVRSYDLYATKSK